MSQSWSVSGATMVACVMMFAMWSCVTSQAGSSGEINGTSSGTGGCATPGQKCEVHDDCCQECYCKGAPFQLDYTSCDIDKSRTCRSCEDYCGDAGVTYKKACSKCVRE